MHADQARDCQQRFSGDAPPQRAGNRITEHLGAPAVRAKPDVAIETAAITLMRHSLMGVADALAISRATLRNMKQNLLGAFIYNSIGIPVAAGILWPFTGTLLNPVVAGAAMALSSITVVSNANRLLRFKPKE